MLTLRNAFLLLFLLTFSPLFAQKVPVIQVADLEKYLQKNNDTVYVLNFWATWCAPCVKELPHFEKADRDFRNEKVKIILVSLDFQKDYQTKLLPFVKKKKIQSEVLWLNEPDGNVWIEKVWKEWEGEIPATLFYRAEKNRLFLSKPLEEAELVEKIKSLLN